MRTRDWFREMESLDERQLAVGRGERVRLAGLVDVVRGQQLPLRRRVQRPQVRQQQLLLVRHAEVAQRRAPVVVSLPRTGGGE